jgi:hypothetical protein
MKRLSVVFMAVTAFALMTASTAQAVTAEKASGSIRMASPKQAITFDVFETTPVKGSITYTNFEYADPGSGVWVPGSTFSVGFGVDPDPTIISVYDFTIATTMPLSPTGLSFTGNGVQQSSQWSGPVTGTISVSALTFTLLEQDGTESYTLNAHGQIDANGAVTGTWSDNYTDPARTGTFSIDDVGDEVFSLTTTPTCVQVDPDNTGPGSVTRSRRVLRQNWLASLSR